MLKPPDYRHMGEEVLPNCHETFIVAEKVYIIVPLALFMIHREKGLPENIIWRRGLAENARILSYGGGVQNCSKNHHTIFEHSLYTIFVW